ncbi:hypothetical protein SERLA73DRAFT_188149 [Serpula lacrymans var. lacrymans S7.3]|uniref:F-box domain-containing protein n=2 Tax=Serpula lacrymans var. lacrymans TaxID=341189 RepID=F8QAU4_SERL3|nr:uncharacterized protein SERLADRAFT_478159 [Serpula lacrymans var. lacrymans S7.9]EGN94330.1 hypothetical protein SERLA73DRAFT_188149 [Serpula lacrymans var. lacrymans S7.3]EGO19817.1 hypothetical protein SERLADRAFT_478159 [Serpula lacrymans var. lacrymans S7.9]
MLVLNADILHVLIAELLSNDDTEVRSSLSTLSRTSRVIRDSCLPYLFAEVKWPHQEMYDDISGLHFFPETLWSYFRIVHLDWPDEWSEPIRLRWGAYDKEGNYTPYHLEKLISAIPHMSRLQQFSMSCPFTPPPSIFGALGRCPTLTTFRVWETPLDIGMILLQPGSVQRVTLSPVDQALRIGDGPINPAFTEVIYYMRDWRRKYRTQLTDRRSKEVFACAGFLRHHSSNLTQLELSGDLCSFATLAANDWPNHPPKSQTFFHAECRKVTPGLLSVLDRMNKLQDLRLLFAQMKSEKFDLLTDEATPNEAALSKLATLHSFAASNACKLDGILSHMSSLSRLAILAIVDLPRWPIAPTQAEVEGLLGDLAGSGSRLTQLRLIVEDKLTPALCYMISTQCPHLETLEIERCGYHDGKSISTWQEFAESLSRLSRLRSLRICMQFPEYDEMDDFEPWHMVREECATFFAKELKSLKRVGFEYRKRAGTHRYQDAWLEYDIVRNDRDGTEKLFQLAPTWYPFPDAWEPSPLNALSF